MNETFMKQLPQTLTNKRFIRIALPVILLLIIGAAMLASPLTSTKQLEKELATSELIEELYGIRIKWIAVVADGGGLDFRWIVVNPDKANEFLHDPDYRPVLVPEGSGVRIQPPQMSHNMVFYGGIAYHTLYSNPGGVVTSGTPVTVEFGEYRLDPIIAQ
ncbi:MAG: hypothetical protein DWQ04_16200 [Chloroflexi bacterium]|nr:MAG: hypothetical protein DWQ04_16200 [Chloroflexota bacterium]